MKHSLSQIPRSRSKSLNKSLSKSGNRSMSGIRLYNFSEIDSYRHINRPFLNEKKKEHIKSKLDLEKTTETKVRDRFKFNNLFLPYDYNPLMPNHSQTILQKTVDPNQRNFLQQIGKIKKKKLKRQEQSKSFIKDQENYQNISNLFRKQASHLGATIRSKQVKKQAILNSQRQIDVNSYGHELNFQQIVNIKEDNHFKKKDERINIFKIIFGGLQWGQGGKILEKYHFSFNSMVEKFQKTKIPVFRDISRQARTQAASQPRYDPNNVQTFTYAQLNFEDLINVAAGRTTPEYIFSMLNLEKAHEFTEGSQEDVEGICYKDKTANKVAIANNDEQSLKQIHEFLRLELQPKQQKFERKYQMRKQAIEKQMQLELNLLKNTIKDQKMHSQIQRQIKEQLQAFLQVDYHYPSDPQGKNKNTRINKDYKDKHQAIKLDKFTNTLLLRNQQQKTVKKLISHRL